MSSSLVPTPKLTAAGLGGAVAIIVIAILGGVGLKIEPTVASAITFVCTWLAGYLKAP